MSLLNKFQFGALVVFSAATLPCSCATQANKLATPTSSSVATSTSKTKADGKLDSKSVKSQEKAKSTEANCGGKCGDGDGGCGG